MSYTTHGHHVTGTPWDTPPMKIEPCGGLWLCRTCEREAELDASRFCKDHVGRALVWSGVEFVCPDCVIAHAFAMD